MGPVGTGLMGSYSGKIRLIEKPEKQDYGGRHVAKRSSDPRVAYPEVRVHLRDLVRVVRIVAPGTGPCGDCRRVLWEPGPAFGENSFHRETQSTILGWSPCV